jgi:hypothetical protein
MTDRELIVEWLKEIKTPPELDQLLYVLRVPPDDLPPSNLKLAEKKAALLQWANGDPAHDDALFQGLKSVLKKPDTSAVPKSSPPLPIPQPEPAPQSSRVFPQWLKKAQPPAGVPRPESVASELAGNIDSDTCVVGGFLSGGTVIPPEQRYHLGQFYFVLAIDALVEHDVRVALLFSDHLLGEAQPEYKVINAMRQSLWRRCFENKAVDIADVHEQITHMQVQGDYRKMRNWLYDNIKAAHDLFAEHNDALEGWKLRTELPPPQTIAQLRKVIGKLRVRDDDLDVRKGSEIVSIATFLRFPPSWAVLGADWCAGIVEFLTNGTAAERFKARRFVIFEGERNRYMWEALRYAAERFGITNFPATHFLPCVPGISTPNAMRFSQPKHKIPLDPLWLDRQPPGSIKAEALEGILKRFDMTKHDPYDAIRVLTREGARRLGQRYPESA